MRVFISALFLLFSLGVSATERLYPAHVDQLFNGSPRIVLLWSVDCPPCYRELAMLEDLLNDHPQLPITLVSTDDDSARYREVEEVHQRFSGEQLHKWVFADMAAPQLRYAIDKGWSGVLPRSYFVAANGERFGHSGVLKAEQVLAWLRGEAGG